MHPPAPSPQFTGGRLATFVAIAAVSLLSIATGFAQVEKSGEVLVTWEDQLPGEPIDQWASPSLLFLEGAEIREIANGSACSGTHYLSKRPTAPGGNAPKGEVAPDPGPLTLLFDAPQSCVSLCVGNPDGKLPRTFTLTGYATKDAAKPIATTQVVLPAGTPFGHPLSLCRVLEHDLMRVELLASDDSLEAFDDLRASSISGSNHLVTFEEHSAGTLVQAQYPGVSFPDRPEIVASDALGVLTRSEPQALRQRIAGESHPGPLTMDFSPSQGAVRLWTGYPPGEKLAGPLRVTLRAYAQSAKGYSLVAEQELELAEPQPLRRALEVCRPELDIARVELQFASTLGGFEVLDDLEFGPRAVAVTPDGTPPQITVDTPANGTVLPQPSSRAEHRTTTATLRGRIAEDQALNTFRIQVFGPDGAQRLDDASRLAIVQGTAPAFTFELPVLLEYGTNRVRLTATDAAGHSTSVEHFLAYLGPPPVEVAGTSPERGYAPVIFREASASGPAISNAPVVVRLTGQHLHAETRFYLVSEERFSLTPSAPDLIEVTPTFRSSAEDAVDLPIPSALYEHPGRYVWLVWDLWSRPENRPWTRGGVFEARAWPYAAFWSFGFRNRDETNSLDDFEAVFGNEVLPGFLEISSPVDGCDRGVNALNFFDGRYLPTVNTRGAGGSCFGFAAASQFFANTQWRADAFDPAVRLPTGFLAADPLRYASVDCAPHTAVSLWANLQTLFGVQATEEFLEAWADQTESVSATAMVGNPVAAAERLRASPTDYVLAFTPFNSTVGHAVAPYRVENRDANTIRLWVLDSNFPYDVRQPEEAVANQIATHRFVDVDRRSNTFRFSLGATTDPAQEYQGTNRVFVGSALVAVPLEVFTGERSIPMWDYFIEQHFAVAGDVEAEIKVADVGSCGWDRAGELHGGFPGLHLVPPFYGDDSTVGNPVFLLSTNLPGAEVRVTGKSPTYQVLTGNGGVIFGARRTDFSADAADIYEWQNDAGRPDRLVFRPGSTTQRWVPELGLVRRGDTDLLFHLHGLHLAAGQELALEALADERGVRVQNPSPGDLEFHAEVEAGSAQTPRDHRWFGPFKLAAGAILDLVPTKWPSIATLEARLDENGDGTADSIAITPGLAIDLKPGDLGDCNTNGILDALDIARNSSVDANADGVPDECSGQGGGSGGGGNTGGSGGTATCPPDGEITFNVADLPEGPLTDKALGLVTPVGAVEVRNGLLVPLPPTDLGTLPTGTLSLRFRCPRGTVTLGVVNPESKRAVRATAFAYAAGDATKPVAQVTTTLPANPGQVVPLTLCRPYDEDIAVVVLEFDGGATVSLRTLTHATRPGHTAHRIDFEDRPAGTVIYNQYPGVTFLQRPVITSAATVGVGPASGTQVLRKVLASESDPEPLTLRFDPPQAEVRVQVGYPAAENDGRPLRVVLRAYAAADKGGPTLVATNEVRVASPRAFDRILRVARCETDIREVQVQFLDRTAAGFEAIDDLEFGPVPAGGTEPDTTAPVIRVLSPASGTVISQLTPANPTGGTNVQIEITEDRALEHVRVRVRNAAGALIGDLDDTALRLSGTAPRFLVSATLPLAYGRNTVEIEATDTAGHTTSTAGTPLELLYLGPAPVTVTSFSTNVVFPEDLVRERSPRDPTTYPEIRLPATVVTLRGTQLNPYVRVHAVRAEDAQIPPRPGTLIATEILSRNAEGTEIQLRPVGGLWSDLDPATDRRLRWVIEDGWNRPDRTQWILGEPFVARQRPWPMTYGFGFVNVDGVNSLVDFDGVFGRNAYLSWTGYCWRDPVYAVFYAASYFMNLNAQPGGSCFGYVAASQSLYNGYFNPDWLNIGFDNEVRLPAGRQSHGNYLGATPDCGPRSPQSLWAWIQTFHGMQQSEEHLYQQLNQIVQHGGVWRGNLRDRLDQLGSQPYVYLLCMKPRGGSTGHCVLPYRVEPLGGSVTRVWVYDPNWPYLHDRPAEDPFNVRSLYSYVDIDTVANSYTFDLDGNLDARNPEMVRNHFHAGRQWSGQGLSVTLLPTGSRTMPGLGYGLDYLFSSVTGEARPQYSTATGQHWGWNADGTLTESLDGAHPFTPFAFAGDDSDQVMLLTRPSNTWTQVAIRPSGTHYEFATGGNGAVLGLRNSQATPGSVDQLEQRIVARGPQAFRFTSAEPQPGLEPFVLLSERRGNNTNLVSWRWEGLSLPAGDQIEFRADPASGVLGAHHEGPAPVVVRLIRESMRDGTTNSIDYGTLTLPADGSVRLTPSGSAEAPQLREELDANGDAIFERVSDRVPNLAGDGPRLGIVRFDHSRRRFRFHLEGVSRADIAVERSRDLTHWDTVTTEPAADDPTDVESAADTESAFFRVRRLR